MPKILTIFLIIFGGIFGTVGGFFSYNSYSIITQGELTKGEIIDYSHKISDGNTMYAPIIKYECTGIQYIKKSNSSSSWKPYDIGEVTDIYCIGNTFIFKNGFDKYFGLIFLIIGLSVMSIPLIINIIKIKKEKLKEELIREGDYIRAKVTFVGYNRYYRVNGRNPMYFQCEYLDEDTKTIYQFKSNNFWYGSLSEYVKIGDERKIFVNRMNMKRYYVDIEDIPKIK